MSSRPGSRSPVASRCATPRRASPMRRSRESPRPSRDADVMVRTERDRVRVTAPAEARDGAGVGTRARSARGSRSGSRGRSRPGATSCSRGSSKRARAISSSPARRPRRSSQRSARARARARPAAPDDAVRGRTVTRIAIANAPRWRLVVAAPLVAVIWLAIRVADRRRADRRDRRCGGWARDLPDVPDLAAWRAYANQTSLVLAADGTHLAELPFRDGARGRPSHARAARRRCRTCSCSPCSPPRTSGSSSTRASTIRRSRAPVDELRGRPRRRGRVDDHAAGRAQSSARRRSARAQTLRRKVREALLARAIEKRWSKRDVLETYLDFVFLGEGAYGMAAGARAYFDKRRRRSSICRESALLAGSHPGARTARSVSPPRSREGAPRRDPRPHGAREPDRRADARGRGSGADRRSRSHTAATARSCRGTPNKFANTCSARSPTSSRAAGSSSTPRRCRRSAPSSPTTRARKRRNGCSRTRTPEIGALVWDHRTGYVEALLGGLQWSRTRRPVRSRHAELSPARLGVEAGRVRRGARRERDHAGHRAARRADRRVRRHDAHELEAEIERPLPRHRARAGRVRVLAQRAGDRRVRSRRRRGDHRARAQARHHEQARRRAAARARRVVRQADRARARVRDHRAARLGDRAAARRPRAARRRRAVRRVGARRSDARRRRAASIASPRRPAPIRPSASAPTAASCSTSASRSSCRT